MFSFAWCATITEFLLKLCLPEFVIAHTVRFFKCRKVYDAIPPNKRVITGNKTLLIMNHVIWSITSFSPWCNTRVPRHNNRPTVFGLPSHLKEKPSQLAHSLARCHFSVFYRNCQLYIPWSCNWGAKQRTNEPVIKNNYCALYLFKI